MALPAGPSSARGPVGAGTLQQPHHSHNVESPPSYEVATGQEPIASPGAGPLEDPSKWAFDPARHQSSNENGRLYQHQNQQYGTHDRVQHTYYSAPNGNEREGRGSLMNHLTGQVEEMVVSRRRGRGCCGNRGRRRQHVPLPVLVNRAVVGRITENKYQKDY